MGGAIVYTYDSANRLNSVDGVEYSWDANGNLHSDGTTTYSYDAANRLVGLTDGVTAYSYTYNGTGDRVGQADGSTTTSYTLDLAAPLSQVLADGAQVYLYGTGRLAQEAAAGRAYLLGDALGSVRLVVDAASGGVGAAHSYAPYGLTAGQVGGLSTVYGFTGEQTDPSGLVYLRARYYDPASGRFISRDRWAGDDQLPMSYNKWLYVNGNPVNQVDPSGLCERFDEDGHCIANNEGIAHTYPSMLAKYVAEAGAAEWTWAEMVTIDGTLWDIAEAYARAYRLGYRQAITQECVPIKWHVLYPPIVSPYEVFTTLHRGQVTFTRKNVTQDYWGESRNSQEIWVYKNVTPDNVASNPRFIVHEMGHTFENVLAGTIGQKAGRINLPTALNMREITDTRYGGFAGPKWDWQWSRCQGSDWHGEIFADMFIGWVYGRWEPISETYTRGGYYGNLRAVYMTSNMGFWIARAHMIREGY